MVVLAPIVATMGSNAGGPWGQVLDVRVKDDAGKFRPPTNAQDLVEGMSMYFNYKGCIKALMLEVLTNT